MHPHCTPWPDERAQELLESIGVVRGADGSGPAVMDARWCAGALDRVTAAARESMSELRQVTHLRTGRAVVEQVASNRRILGEDGKIKAVRWTRTYDPAVRAEPEGLIDPWLKTVSFWDGAQKLAALHYYAVHPTSYEDSFITNEFTGIARERRRAEDGDVPHLYFTECAGNITAGKYNDGATENRELFTCRVHRAMVESEQDTREVPIDGSFEWRTTSVQLPPRADMNDPDLTAVMRDAGRTDKERARAALMLAYLERCRAGTPIDIAALHFGDAVSLLHLPAEAFIEYQHFAQQQRPDSFVAVPAYGDCGPGYICLERSFAEGGYEPSDSFCAPDSEQILRRAIVDVMAPR
jgi:hypothetical protein